MDSAARQALGVLFDTFKFEEMISLTEKLVRHDPHDFTARYCAAIAYICGKQEEKGAIICSGQIILYEENIQPSASACGECPMIPARAGLNVRMIRLP